MKNGIVFSWSGGKDSTMALHLLINSKQPVDTLITTVTSDYDRISIHGVRKSLLKAQSESIGMPLEEVILSKESSDQDYETKMKVALDRLKTKGDTTVAFGDIFLKWLREKRISLAQDSGMDCAFPLWGRDTTELAREFIKLGYKAIITCVDSKALSKEFAGREFNEKLLSDLPEEVDPCGENGEFHTFVYEGPIFKKKIEFEKGEVVFRENRFYYCDLIPK
jgi:uncharacterized protein (TIGR00290 family)